MPLPVLRRYDGPGRLAEKIGISLEQFSARLKHNRAAVCSLGCISYDMGERHFGEVFEAWAFFGHPGFESGPQPVGDERQPHIACDACQCVVVEVEASTRRRENGPFGMSTSSEKVPTNWPAIMSHHGECGFESKRTGKTSGPEQFAR